MDAARMRLLVVHGPNANLFGRREAGVYGTVTFDQINDRLRTLGTELGVELVIVQSNQEGVLVDALQQNIDSADGAIINPAGLSSYSVALHDAIKMMPFPVIEVHMSNLATRDEIHRHSIISAATQGMVMGLGWRSYTAALRALVDIVREQSDGKVQAP